MTIVDNTGSIHAPTNDQPHSGEFHEQVNSQEFKVPTMQVCLER